MSDKCLNQPHKLSKAGLNLLTIYQDEIDRIDPQLRTDYDTKKRTYLRKGVMTMRDELKDGRSDFLARRKAQLTQLLKSEAVQQENWIRDVGYAYIPTQP